MFTTRGTQVFFYVFPYTIQIMSAAWAPKGGPHGGPRCRASRATVRAALWRPSGVPGRRGKVPGTSARYGHVIPVEIPIIYPIYLFIIYQDNAKVNARNYQLHCYVNAYILTEIKPCSHCRVHQYANLKCRIDRL